MYKTKGIAARIFIAVNNLWLVFDLEYVSSRRLGLGFEFEGRDSFGILRF